MEYEIGISSSSVVTFNMTITNSPSIIISIFIGIFSSLIALVTSLGNIVVLLAFYCDKKLRTINDYFILNMAIADFLIGFICIPFYIPFSITQSWPFGRFFCKIWVTIDDVATMASVINIVAISINRYWSIAYPLSYRKYVKQHFVYLVMGGVWCLSFINFAPGIWLLSLFDKENNLTNVTRSDCSGDYNHSFVYMLIAQFNYFIWPFIVLCILNMLLMLNIWKRSRKMSRFTSCIKVKVENVGSSPLGISKDTEDDQQHLSILSKHRRNSIERCPSIILEENENIVQTSSSTNKYLPDLFNKYKKKSSRNSQYTITYLSSFIQKNKSSKIKKSRYSNRRETPGSSPIVFLSRKSTSVNYSLSRNYRSDSPIEYQMDSEMEVSKPILHEIRSTNKCQKVRAGQSRIIRDRKAARSLFILVIVFLIFLFPYVICATASTAGAHISTLIFEISFWLLWLNSTFNPFLYPFIQIKYRRAYVKLFRSFGKYLTFSRSNHSF